MKNPDAIFSRESLIMPSKRLRRPDLRRTARLADV